MWTKIINYLVFGQFKKNPFRFGGIKENGNSKAHESNIEVAEICVGIGEEIWLSCDHQW